jgi:hypothetical protein
MKSKFFWLIAATALMLAGCSTAKVVSVKTATLQLKAPALSATTNGLGTLRLDEIFYETEAGRAYLPFMLTALSGEATLDKVYFAQTTMADGRAIKISITPEGDNFNLKLSASPAAGIVKWGFAIDAHMDEYFTGWREPSKVDPQPASQAPDSTPNLNLRGQRVDMSLNPPLSIYAPFYASSRGYAIFAKTDRPGKTDFCGSDPTRVKIEFEGSALAVKIYTSQDPATLLNAPALEAGQPLPPPK